MSEREQFVESSALPKRRRLLPAGERLYEVSSQKEASRLHSPGRGGNRPAGAIEVTRPGLLGFLWSANRGTRIGSTATVTLREASQIYGELPKRLARWHGVQPHQQCVRDLGRHRERCRIREPCGHVYGYIGALPDSCRGPNYLAELELSRGRLEEANRLLDEMLVSVGLTPIQCGFPDQGCQWKRHAIES